MPKRLTWSGFLLILLVMSACQQAIEPAPLAVLPAQPVVTETATAISTLATLATSTTAAPPDLPPTHTPVVSPTPQPPTATPTPFYRGPLSEPCGSRLPLLPQNRAAPVTSLTTNEDQITAVRNLLPETAVPAFERLLADPANVGLAVYRLGDEANGLYLNADRQMPLASVVKLVQLAAYAEAAASGQLNPVTTVPLSELERYYLPGYDLGAHERSISELTAAERISQEQLPLREIPYMMMRYSSNAAADYLHWQLGQATIEETAVNLGLSQQTAPCTWLGQFMAMANHTSAAFNDRQRLETYLTEPALYGSDASLLTDAYVNSETFREDEQRWHRQNRRPSVHTQQFFGQNLNAQGTAREYAQLMARFAQNGLSNADSSYLARTYLEWPMVFEDNQALFTNLGYKNGSLPGILTTVYYAYPRDGSGPIVVALFYQNLPNRLYQQWRRELPHDDLARWLLYDPQALPTLKSVLTP